MPSGGYQQFVNVLHEAGVARDDFRVMCRDNADFLLHG
jgi:hypothetical protein